MKNKKIKGVTVGTRTTRSTVIHEVSGEFVPLKGNEQRWSGLVYIIKGTYAKAVLEDVHIVGIDRFWSVTMKTSRLTAILCVCGCGEVILVPSSEIHKYYIKGWVPIYGECYSRIRRRFRGKRRLSYSLAVYWVRPRGQIYVQ